MNWKVFLQSNWKKILVVLILIAVFYFNGLTGFVHIPGIGFKSGGAIVGGYKTCLCLGIPNNDIRIGGSRFYCIGIVYDCHCYVTSGCLGINETQEVDCNCHEGMYYIDFPTGRTDYCNLFRSW